MNTNLKNKKKDELIDIINSQNEVINNLTVKIDNISKNAVKASTLREKINDLAKRYQENENKLNKLKKVYDENLDKHEKELQRTIIIHNSKIREKDNEYNSLKDSYNIVLEENKTLKTKINCYDATIKQLNADINGLQSENNDLFEKLENKNEIIDNMASTIDKNELDIINLLKDLKAKESLAKTNIIIYIVGMIIVTLFGIFVF